MSDPHPFPEKREEPYTLRADPVTKAPSHVLGDPAYATVDCPCCKPEHAKTLYYTADDVTHAYCAGCDHMHRLPEAIKKKRLS